MSEGGREPLIRLPVDQEVYVEAVAAGDTVEDATVATEVVAFDRDQDMYQLEGAIVFAGYVRKEAATVNADAEVVHVHQRLPFVLRVPIAAQTPGLVNVKSRLSGFALTVAADHWLHAMGHLEIHGLSGEQGYHFRCGGQEEGELGQRDRQDEELDVTVEAVEAATEYGDGNAGDADSVQAVNVVEDVLQEVDGQGASDADTGVASAAIDGETERAQETFAALADPAGSQPAAWHESPSTAQTNVSDDAVNPLALVGAGDFRQAPADDDANEERFVREQAVEDVSAARAGHGWADRSQEEDETTSRGDETARKQLSEFDRFFVQPVETVNEPSVAESPGPQETGRDRAEPVASFEFEHQVDLDQTVVHDTAPSVSLPVEAARSEVAEESTALKVTISAAVPSDAVGADSDGDGVEDTSLERSEKTLVSIGDHGLWSFVDFNGPESRYTLRYVIVMEDETLEAVADRSGCLPSELQRANPWLNGPVLPGMALAVPSQPFTLPKIVSF
ncbi:hypothetical protein C7445_1057 [Alicyclobacillus sacchari]|uniref:LysM domain-containing protein n=1 Tax=Alicyclobacillus sacchari TaxID=392010 RepID=A0A4R8LR30_9BACL|nr:LysM domain-containing protein [Alicyclobacillus sacchari]TDY47834.1 hypothetical protein C7445_1057 [Alicyclobacillus sacchari]